MKREYYECLRQSLISERKRQCLSQDEAAKLINKPQSFVSKYETGERRLDIIELVVICKKLNIPLEKIIHPIERIIDLYE